MYEPQTKPNVEFKPAKRMKKRRQLDALVGNGKTRRKTKSGHEALPVGSESESSDIDEFDISDQNTLLRKSRHTSSCSLCSSIFGIFTLAACLIGCGALFWMHFKLKQSIDEVKEKIFEVQTKNGESVGSFQNLESELAKLKKTVDSYTTGSNGIADMHKHLDDISKKIVALNTSTQSLRDLLGLKSSAEFQETIKKVPILSKNVATLGVDVKSLHKTVTSLEAFRKSADQQIKALSSKDGDNAKPVTGTQPPPTIPQNAMSPEIANQISKKFEDLRDDLEKSNITFHAELAKIRVVLDGHKNKFAVIDDTTADLKKKLDKISDGQNTPGSTGDDSQGQKGLGEEEVKVIVHQMIEDMGIANATSNTDNANLQSLINNMDNVTNIVQSLRTKLVQMENEEKGTGSPNVLDHNDLIKDVQTMNKTVVHLEADLMTLMQKVTQQQNKLVNISHTVETIQKFVAEIDKDHTSIRTDISKMSGSTSSSSKPSVSSTSTQSPTQTSSSSSASTKGQEGASSVSSTTPGRNYPPLANTAGKLTVHLPLTELVLDATNSTDDKSIVKYRWEQMQGPNILTLTDVKKANTTATGDIQEGLYTFAVQVWDQEHLSSEMQLLIDVKPSLPGSEFIQSTPAPIEEGLHRYINMSLVKTMDDLDLGVRRWDKDGDGFVNAEDLQDYMPDPPNPQDLLKFDFDHNGKYDKNELAVALGFKQWPNNEVGQCPINLKDTYIQANFINLAPFLSENEETNGVEN
ncbi:hypothetical protein FSP39_017246 [Pinctada imbricata]|uniref:EF-hand domain-containing protein n=1 Tax=Pinctada imbricata TaxID=66713 RepID=A0AA89BUB5_PINIB|nr:hypothetical protein FSP39_017246 [Pinctada imbricata]